ncbi:hypothetical protein ACFTWD_37295 [Streptomyces sp. NPDC056943]|uniref:hypothetical protein n=1 Tax=Streptomyces sp. NPDC056943 TaxID=3345971 RepID=UPI0036425AE5
MLPPPPRKSSRTCLAVALALGGIVVLAGIAVVALLGTVEAPGRDDPDGPAGDVKITAYAADASTKRPRADLDVTIGEAADKLHAGGMVVLGGGGLLVLRRRDR